MRNCFIFLLLASCVSIGQTASSTPVNYNAHATSQGDSKAANAGQTNLTNETKSNKDVPLDAAVLTIGGICQQKPPSGECKTVITREQFELFAESVAENRFAFEKITPAQKRTLAENLAAVIVLADRADKDSTANDLRTKQLLRFARERVLAQREAEKLRTVKEPSDAEIQKYYNDNKEQFWEADVERILIPLHGSGNKGPDESATKELADGIYTRAQAGEPFDKLQKEVNEKFGLSGTRVVKFAIHPDPTRPTDENRVRDMKPGETKIENDGVSGYEIIKLISTGYLPLDHVKTDIGRSLKARLGHVALESAINSHPAAYNDNFFGQETHVQMSMPMPPPRNK